MSDITPPPELVLPIVRFVKSDVTISLDHEGFFAYRSNEVEVADWVGMQVRLGAPSILSTGRMLRDILHHADRIAKAFNGTIVNRKEVVSAIQADWVGFIQRHMEIFGHSSYVHLEGSLVKVSARKRSALAGNHTSGYCIEVGNPKFLVVPQMDRIDWRCKWENIFKIEVSYVGRDTRLRKGS